MTASFNDPWYHQMIEKYMMVDSASRDAQQVAIAIMIAGGFIAEAHDDTVVRAIRGLERAIDDFGDKLTQNDV